jgi:hypothetical protein
VRLMSLPASVDGCDADLEHLAGVTKMRALYFALLLLLVWAVSACAQPNQMQFRAYPPKPDMQMMMGEHAWAIYATGEIDGEAGKRLEMLIANKRIPLASRLFLNSPGGSLLGGMALGRVIRAHLLQTFIGQIHEAGTPGIEPGYCYSACALAFLGGEYRYLPDGSVYGVHRFFWQGHTSADADVAQIVSAAVVEYIKTMGVDTKLFALASQAGSSEAITPSAETLLTLNVINNGSKQVKWTIESVAGGIYLKGEQETALGINKFMFTCPAHAPMDLYAIFDPGQNADEVMAWSTHWLFYDGDKMQIEKKLVEKSTKNGWINLRYLADPELVRTIAGTKSKIGVGLSPAPEAAIFSGFDMMPFEGGAAKLPGFLQVCGGTRRSAGSTVR